MKVKQIQRVDCVQYQAHLVYLITSMIQVKISDPLMSLSEYNDQGTIHLLFPSVSQIVSFVPVLGTMSQP